MTFVRWASSISGPTSTPGSVPRPTFSAPIFSASRRENSSASDSCTWKRLAAVHASPTLRILASIAPSTAASRSASSNTRNGALPPSSIDTRRICCADCSISERPTSVEPVNDSLRVRSSFSSGSITAPACLALITLSTPSGNPASCEDLGEREHRQRRLLGGLDDHRAAGCDRGGDLAGAHRGGEVPRRDEHTRPHGLAHREDAALASGVDHVAAVYAHGLLGEPAEELGRVGDLSARLGDGLAHLQRHQQREIVGLLDDRLIRPAQDLAALARRMTPPTAPARRLPRRARRGRPAAARRPPPRAARWWQGPRQ